MATAKPKPKAVIHLMHASTVVDNTDAAEKELIRASLEHGADIITYTEMAGSASFFRTICRANGYTPVTFANNPGETFALNKDTVKLKTQGDLMVYPTSSGTIARYVNWIKVIYGSETIWHHTAHWQPNADWTAARVKRHNEMTQQVAAQVRKHATGNDLVFFSGDANADAQNDGKTDFKDIFRHNQLLTIWDEFKVYPITRGRSTIDVIGSYVPQTRIKAIRYKVWPRVNSDHRPISAWYEISGATGPAGGGAGGGTGGGTKPVTYPEDYHSIAELRDWSDYFDGAIYHLPQAVDDSGDKPTHGDTIT